MWFFGCGNRKKSGIARNSTTRYPVAPGQPTLHCHRGKCSPMLKVFSLFGIPGNAFGQPYYSGGGGMAPAFYYPQQQYTYGPPHAQYVAPPRAPRRDAYYPQVRGPPPSYYTASPKTSSYTSTPASASSGISYTVTTQPTNAPVTSRRKVTFGRVDVREFRGGGRGGT